MNNTFAEDVRKGLSASQKRLNSKYFYDDEGSRIFQEIMNMDEYYLTNCEFEIFKNQAGAIYDKLNFNGHFNLIELGAGDGLKTAEIIRYLMDQKVNFTYQPIDISQEANDLLSAKMKEAFPNLEIAPQTGDYFQVLENLKESNSPSLLLFIGSNIGNYSSTAAADLIQLFYSVMNTGDKLLIGVDLKKNPFTVHRAYYDSEGITKRFNINLLHRINRELGGNFQTEHFDFYVSYNPENGEVRSYLVSLADQKVHINALDQTFQFKNGETIWTELSKKYTVSELNDMAVKEGLTPIASFLDKNEYFSDSLFEK